MVTVSRSHYDQCATRIGPDRIYAGSGFPHPIRFRFLKKACAEPTRIRSGWPGQVLAKRIWSGSKPVCKSHRARFLAERNQPATSFAFSDSDAFFHRRAGSNCENRFWLTVSGFGQTDPVRKQANVQKSSGPLLANASQPIWIGCEWDPACLLFSCFCLVHGFLFLDSIQRITGYLVNLVASP